MRRTVLAYDDFEAALMSGEMLTGEVEGLGTVEWRAIPKWFDAPNYPYHAYEIQGDSFASQDYLMIVTPPPLYLDKKKVEKCLIKKAADGTRIVNMGTSRSEAVKLEKDDKVIITTDNEAQRLKIVIERAERRADDFYSLPITYPYKTLPDTFPVLCREYETEINPKAINFIMGFMKPVSVKGVLSLLVEYANKGTYGAGAIAQTAVLIFEAVKRFRSVESIGGYTVYNPMGRIGKFANAAKKVADKAKPYGTIGATVTIATDLLGMGFHYLEDPNHPLSVTPQKAITDGIFILIGRVGSVGGIVSFIYFGVDSWYPGGWKSFYEDFIAPKKRRSYEEQVARLTAHPLESTHINFPEIPSNFK